MSCLIIKNDGVGDLVLASGIISQLSEALGMPVELLTCKENREVAEGIPNISRYHYITRRGPWFSRRFQNLGILVPRSGPHDRHVIKRLKQRDFEIAICLRRFIRQNSLSVMKQIKAKKKLCGWQIPTNISHNNAERATNIWVHYSGEISTLNELSYYEAMLQHFGIVLPRIAPNLSFCQTNFAPPRQGRIGLIISGSSTEYPYGYWHQLIELLIQAGYKIVLFGGPDQASSAQSLELHHPQLENNVGKLSWTDAPRELAQTQLIIGNDTGLTHLASVSCAKVLIIQGGGTFRRFFPWPTATNQFILYHAMDCYDCDWKCKHERRRCIDAVTPTKVFNYAQKILNGEVGPSVRNLNPECRTYNLNWRNKKQNQPDTPFSFPIASSDDRQPLTPPGE